MGYAKEQMLEDHERWLVATQIAVDAGVLTRCPYHDYVSDALNGDNTPAYKLGNSRFTAGELDGSFSSRQEMTDAIKAAIEDAGLECAGCESARD